jgi:hypothetical protein
MIRKCSGQLSIQPYNVYSYIYIYEYIYVVKHLIAPDVLKSVTILTYTLKHFILYVEELYTCIILSS